MKMAPSNRECEVCNLTFTTELEHQSHLKTHLRHYAADTAMDEEMEDIIVPEKLSCENEKLEILPIRVIKKEPLDDEEKSEEVSENSQHLEVQENSNELCIEDSKISVGQLRGKIKGKFTDTIQSLISLLKPSKKRKNATPQTEERMHWLDRRKTSPQPKEKFECSVCKMEFSRKYHLDRHLQLTPCSGRPSPVHKCEVCGKIYTRKDNLRVHLRSHTGEPKYRRRLKHTCNFCDKKFHGVSLLNIHVRKHTGERPFQCEFCQKGFPAAVQLNKHRRIHTGEKPYSCTECGQRGLKAVYYLQFKDTCTNNFTVGSSISFHSPVFT